MGTPSISTALFFCCVQLINGVSTLDRDAVNHMHQELMKLRSCKGHKECNQETGESCHVFDEHLCFDVAFQHNTNNYTIYNQVTHHISYRW